MLKINIDGFEFYNSETEEFVYTKPTIVRLEHSLISLSKWEGIWEKPFLPTAGVVSGMTGLEEEKSYIECMIIGEPVEYISDILLQNYIKLIKDYIEKAHTATTIHRLVPPRPSRQIITSELIYYWMLKFGIPFDCERWHLNRLLKLIEVCNVKESSGKNSKLSTKDAAKYIHELNRTRRTAYDTNN